MRRDSAPARRLLAVAADHGTNVTGRQIERWSTEGLLPPEGTSAVLVARHLALADTFTGPRRSHDVAALRLAAAGHGCTRYRTVLLRAWQVLDEIPAAFPQSFDDETDHTEEAEAPADEGWDCGNGDPSDGVALMREMLQHAVAKNPETIGGTKDCFEPSDGTWHSLLTQGYLGLLGGTFYSPGPFKSALPLLGRGELPTEADLQTVQATTAAIPDMLRALPVEASARAALWQRTVLADLPGDVARLGLPADPEALDTLAAVCWPLVLVGQPGLQAALSMVSTEEMVGFPVAPVDLDSPTPGT